MKRDFERYPKYKHAYILAFDKMLKAREEAGLKTLDIWGSAEGVMEWWVGDRTSKSTEIEGQIGIGDSMEREITE